MGFYSLDVLGRDAERNGVEIRLPDVNASDVWCMIERDAGCGMRDAGAVRVGLGFVRDWSERSEEHTSELQSQSNLVCRLLLEKKKNKDRKERCGLGME